MLSKFNELLNKVKHVSRIETKGTTNKHKQLLKLTEGTPEATAGNKIWNYNIIRNCCYVITVLISTALLIVTAFTDLKVGYKRQLEDMFQRLNQQAVSFAQG